MLKAQAFANQDFRKEIKPFNRKKEDHRFQNQIRCYKALLLQLLAHLTVNLLVKPNYKIKTVSFVYFLPFNVNK
jgi:hypothetical protein